MMTQNQSRMIGPGSRTGPGGRNCPCCNVPAGKARRQARRRTKRSKKEAAWKAEAFA